MPLVAVAMQLWRSRRVMMLGASVALMAAFAVSFSVKAGPPSGLRVESRQYYAGVAAADVLVDSPRSQVVDVGGGSAGSLDAAAVDISTLSTRARLLANLMSTSPLKDRIADAAGIDAKTLIVVAPTSDSLAPRVTPPTSTNVELGDRDASVLRLHVDETLPIISMAVQAPSSETAGRLASSAVSRLRGHLRSVAATESIPDAHRLVVKPLGPATAGTQIKGPPRMLSILAFILVLAVWTVAVVLVPRASRAWAELSREPGAAERSDDDVDGALGAASELQDAHAVWSGQSPERGRRTTGAPSERKAEFTS